jgi:Tol biopolymer transport system component
MSEMIERLNAALEGRYRIERELGEGGMATVYLAEDLKHDRKVAVKVLRPELAAVVGAERFLAEIRTTANLEDPHILPLYDSGEADSFLFYVMPYVEGDSLRDRIDREHQLPVDDAVAIARKVGSALSFAHQQGIVHRDVKPANILMRRGEPLVADFGIALALSEAGGGRITETGLSLGTPHYMSPEQAAGERSLDPRSDVYALACVLYEMLAGEPPHPGPTAQAVLAKILTDQPRRIMELRRSVPEHVDGALARALEKLPADRFDSVASFVEALDDPTFRHDARGPARTTRTGVDALAAPGAGGGGRPALRWLGVAAVAVLALIAAWGWLRPTGAGEPLTMVHMALPDSQRLAVRSSPRMDLSPDGRSLAYVGPGGGGGMLWLRELDKLDARPIRGTEGAHTPVFSPDGASVAFVTGTPGDLKVVGLQGEAPVTLIQDSAYSYGITWSDDGWIYVTDDLRILRIRSQGGALEEVVVPSEARGETWVGWPHVLPGGRYLLFEAWYTSAGDAMVGIHDLETGRDTVLARGLYPRWSTTGHVVFTRVDGTIMAAPFDERTLGLDTEPAVIFGRVGVNASQGYGEYTLSRTGRLVYRTGAASLETLLWVDRDGVETPVDTAFEGDFGSIALSQDGTSVVADVGGSPSTNIFVKDLAGGPWRRVSFEDGFKSRPEWVPGRAAVSYIADRGQQGDSAADGTVANADGSGNARTVLDLDQRVQEITWSPDGEWLVYRIGPLGASRRDIYGIDGGGTGDTVALATTPFDEHSPAISPDGRWLAYVSSESGRAEVFVRPFPDVNQGKWQVSTKGGTEPVWGRTGRELFYRAPNADLIAARYVTDRSFAVSERVALFSTESYDADPVHSTYDVSVDDRRFLFARNTGDEGTLVLVQNWFEELLERVGGDR